MAEEMAVAFDGGRKQRQHQQRGRVSTQPEWGWRSFDDCPMCAAAVLAPGNSCAAAAASFGARRKVRMAQPESEDEIVRDEDEGEDDGNDDDDGCCDGSDCGTNSESVRKPLPLPPPPPSSFYPHGGLRRACDLSCPAHPRQQGGRPPPPAPPPRICSRKECGGCGDNGGGGGRRF